MDKLGNALRLVRRPSCLPTNWRILQRELDRVLHCRTAFAGSLSLYLQGEVKKFGDLDIVTDRMFRQEDLPWPTDSCWDFGLKNHKLGLDVFFLDKPDNLPMLRLANQHVATVEGIRVQYPTFVKQINWYWRDADAKQRLCIPPTDDVLGRA